MHRPSARRNSLQKPVELNLVPILDSLVTLIAFLMMTMSLVNLVSVETPFPMVSSEQNQKLVDEKPLQLTLSFQENAVEIWSPFAKIQPLKIADSEPGKPDLAKIHAFLVDVKKKFPSETKIVLVPTPTTNYDVIVSIMDSVRILDATDAAIFSKNPKTGLDEQTKTLFPEIVFGNLLGDS
ncbi:MAG: biopolymer transporter ExbD [Bdellovibrionales bacterium]|nr:biopolymer transporter ExbD [Bdellovibrionales bacterium]